MLQMLVDFEDMWFYVAYARNVWGGRGSFSEVRYSRKLVQYCSAAVCTISTILGYSGVWFVLSYMYLQ